MKKNTDTSRAARLAALQGKCESDPEHRTAFVIALTRKAMFESSKMKAIEALDAGRADQSLPHIEGMASVARTTEDRAYTEMLRGNRCKDLGLFSEAEDCYERARTLAPAESPFEVKVLTNLACLWAELGSYQEAQRLAERLLEKDPEPMTHAFLLLVRGMCRHGQSWHDDALRDFRSSRTEFEENGARHHVAWAAMHEADILAGSVDSVQRNTGIAMLAELVDAWSPSSDQDGDLEVAGWSLLKIARHRRDIGTAERALALGLEAKFAELVRQSHELLDRLIHCTDDNRVSIDRPVRVGTLV